MLGSIDVPASDEDLIQLFQRVNNAGRWGPHDELGTLNFITPEKRRQASLLVREGRVLSLALPIPGPASRGLSFEHRMLGVVGAADDEVAFAVHQENFTHLDCVSHIASYDGFAYNRRRYDHAVTTEGVTLGSIRAQAGGIVTRGVLLDLPAALGIPALAPQMEFTPSDLTAAESHARTSVATGDAVVVRTGVQASDHAGVLRPGPGAHCIEWMYEREVALYTGDSPERITPLGAQVLGLSGDDGLDPHSGSAAATAVSTRFPLPFHQIAIPAMGLALLDFCAVEELSRTCAELGRYEFLFVALPLPIEGGTGSPVNPVAIF